MRSRLVPQLLRAFPLRIPDPGDIRALRKTYRYQRMRRKFLRENPLCAECERNGKISVAKELDHVLPAHKRPDLFWDRANWQGLCLSCHHSKSLREHPQRDPKMEMKRRRFEEMRRRVKEGG